MATVNMNCVEFYNPNPKPALKASHAQLTKSVLNKHRLSLQPSRSPSAMSAGDVQDNDSLDDSLPSLEELLRPPQNRNIPQVPHQSQKPLHMIDEGRLLTDATTPNSAYVPGNNQKEPLIIEDDSDNESDAEAEAGVDWSNLQPQLLARIGDQDASECGLATQDAASTTSSLFGPSTPQDSDYLGADCFSKDEQERLSLAKLDSTFPVQVRRPSSNSSELAETTGHDQIHQGVEKAIVDEMRPSLRERAGGSYDRGSVCNIEDRLRQTSAEAGGSLPSSPAHSHYNQMGQESQNNTDIGGISSEERLWEKTIEQQHCQQKEQEDEDEDDIEASSGEDKGPISYCQQIKDSSQHQRVEDDTIVEAPLSQVCEHSVKPYEKDNEDNDIENSEDDEDEDVRPPIRRKRRRRESDATETATRKKAHMSSSTVGQAQTCTTRGSTVSRSSPGDADSVLGADYQEYPLQGFLKCVRIGRETTYNLEFTLLDLPDSFRPSIGLYISNSTSSGESVGGSPHPWVCASHAKKSQPALQKQRKRPPLRERIVSRPGRHSTYSEDDDELLIQLKEDDKLPWDNIAEYFPERTKGSLQVHYTTKLKNRSQTSKYKKRKITNSARGSGERYPSRFSTDLLDPQLQDAHPSFTSILPATADSTKGAHRGILSTGNKKHTAVQLRCSSQGVESDTDEICDVEALLAKLTVRNVVWYLVKWEGFGDDKNTWQEQDDISSDLVDNFEASYQGNFGVELLKKRERRGKIEYFVKWNGRPSGENSWEKEDTIHSERIKEFAAR